MENNTQLMRAEQTGVMSVDSFTHMQRVAKMLSVSDIVPDMFKGEKGVANCVIALEMANRMGASYLAVMQNIYIVYGKPGWSSTFIIACINTCGRYSPLRFLVTGEGDKKTCTAWALEKETQERLESPPVSIGMAKSEGWFDKKGSKWQTMPDLMLRYRAATLFGRLYAPEILMGMRTVEEVLDVESELVPIKRVSDAPKFTPAPELPKVHVEPASEQPAKTPETKTPEPEPEKSPV